MTDINQHLILELGGREWVIRILALAFIPLGIALLAATPWILISLAKVDGTPEPIGARLTLAALTGISGVFMSAGLWLFCHLYALRVTRRAEHIDITTTRVLWNTTQRFNLADFAGGTSHEGALRTFHLQKRLEQEHLVTASVTKTPFETLYATGLRLPIWARALKLPLIFDVQARIYDKSAFLNLRSKD